MKVELERTGEENPRSEKNQAGEENRESGGKNEEN